jgi:hypothetical protein
MAKRAPTIDYQVFWLELHELAGRIGPLSRDEKDREMADFARHHKSYIFMDYAHDGVIEVGFRRNLLNYLKRNGLESEAEIFRTRFLEFAKRRNGSARERRPS